jgi:hypothetical protein
VKRRFEMEEFASVTSEESFDNTFGSVDLYEGEEPIPEDWVECEARIAEDYRKVHKLMKFVDDALDVIYTALEGRRV